MSTTNETNTGAWELVHTSVADGTSVILTAKKSPIEYALMDSEVAPADGVFGHIIAPGIDRELFPASGVSLYKRGAFSAVVVTTITAGA